MSWIRWSTNVRLGQIWMRMTNTLAYYAKFGSVESGKVLRIFFFSDLWKKVILHSLDWNSAKFTPPAHSRSINSKLHRFAHTAWPSSSNKRASLVWRWQAGGPWLNGSHHGSFRDWSLQSIMLLSICFGLRLNSDSTKLFTAVIYWPGIILRWRLVLPSTTLDSRPS